MKILSFNIRNGNIEVTGDSSKGTLVDSDKKFLLEEASHIVMNTEVEQQAFIKKLLQDNHKYTHDGKLLTVDNIVYWVTPMCITTRNNGHKYYFESRGKRNYFKEYTDFLKFHMEEMLLVNLTEKIEKLLKINQIDKIVGDVKKKDDKLHVQLESSYRNSFNSEYPNFELELSIMSNELKFLHFLESEGEYYSNGNAPITKDDIRAEIAKQYKMLEDFDKLSNIFNNKTL